MNELQQHGQNESCIDKGLLTSLRDGELSSDERTLVTAHLATCPDCAADECGINASGQEAYSLLDTLQPSVSDIPQTAQALATLQAKIALDEDITGIRMVSLTGKQPLPFAQKRRRQRYSWMIAAVAAVLVAVLILPNAGVVASQFLALFQVKQFQPVKLDANQGQQEVFSALSNFADVQMSNVDNTHLTNPTRAQVQSHLPFPLLLPTRLPTGVSTDVQYDIFGGGKATFTFDAKKAKAYMQQIGDGNIAIPAQLDGAVYTVTISPGVAIQYGTICQQSIASGCNEQRRLVLAEIPSPVVHGDTNSLLADLRDFMLSLPHLPADVHTLWQNTDLSTGTIPLPMPSLQTNTEQVTVNGGSGVLLTDNSIKYGGVIWQAKGIIYAIVTNTNDKTQILDSANSLQ